jgi:hypothetical protein
MTSILKRRLAVQGMALLIWPGLLYLRMNLPLVYLIEDVNEGSMEELLQSHMERLSSENLV